MHYVRRMTQFDIERVFDIEKRAHIEPWTEQILKDCVEVDYECWVLMDRSGMVGFAIFEVEVGECHVFNICVAPEKQGQGYGRVLLNHILEVSTEQEAECVILEVRVGNAAARGLYRSAGFKEVGTRKDYYPTPTGREDAIILRLDF